VLEYMAARPLVVASDVGSAREAGDEGITCYLVDAGDDTTIADRLGWFLRDGYRAKLMGAHARRTVLERPEVAVPRAGGTAA
jgi:glycosyltransferase involved in cell wall biosynthesis